ncbi:DUF819 family protein [Arsenicibacter rosenii]|uniref:DUF819 family protein n=1 Tax=Arsenicibacter rosenii TaxID=1750698 RepID=A0A1S2VCR1_9BACT|nr:DUF819 family protein [Arsenicibacter rosenii]OIN56210.1 hypothetical protein BLX24_25770 [Arsenicibacter rosenii]
MTDALFILFILSLNVVICEWLSQKPVFRDIGTALLVIILTAVEANLRLIPTTDTPVYDGIFGYVAPFSLFLLLLSVNLKDLRQAGLPMVTMYLIGSVAVIIGVVTSVWVFSAPETVGRLYYALAGMFTGTYIGGSINFHAVALHYNVSKAGNLFVAATAADNILTALWMVATLAIPRYMQARYPRRLPTASRVVPGEGIGGHPVFSDAETVSPMSLALLLALGFAAIFVSKQLAALFPALPFVLILTTIALVLAQFRTINHLKGGRLLGLFGVYIFLAVIGAYCDIAALLRDGKLALVLFGMILLLVAIHAVILFGIGALLKQDWDVLGIASQANIGGATSALALARSLNRTDLQLPAVLVGTLGNAIGTYLGILVAELLR